MPSTQLAGTHLTAGRYLNANTQIPVFRPGLVAVLSAESLVQGPAASLSHRQVLPGIAGTQRVEGGRAVGGTAADDRPLAATTTYGTWHSNPISTDAVQAFIGIAQITRNDGQVWLP